ncbi:MAG TPA: dTDP-4-dehydrorhamnose reductase [Acidimicrobiia bacterium]|nr:dTDP-4-dehydrorhamnose reductase [Acidimicrobiia bacterium]
MIAVLGAGGQLGTAFIRLLDGDAVPLTRADIDLTRPEEIEPWIASNRPELVINCAAYTAVDAAEEHESTARLVNATAVGYLAESTARRGAGLVTFSTDYVFDGTKDSGYFESDPPHPLNVYGETKLEGEQLAMEKHPGVLVIRTSWVLSGTHRNFASSMLELIAKGPVRVVNDQRGKPTLVDDLAAATMEAVQREASGVVHLTNQGETTWFGLARDIAEFSGLDPDHVMPITTDQFPRPAARPTNSVLDSERLDELSLDPLPHYRPSLRRAVEQLLSTGRPL